jgi:hypothetical protein
VARSVWAWTEGCWLTAHIAILTKDALEDLLKSDQLSMPTSSVLEGLLSGPMMALARQRLRQSNNYDTMVCMLQAVDDFCIAEAESDCRRCWRCSMHSAADDEQQLAMCKDARWCLSAFLLQAF